MCTCSRSAMWRRATRSRCNQALQWRSPIFNGRGTLRIPLTVGDIYGRSGLPDSDRLISQGRTSCISALRLSWVRHNGVRQMVYRLRSLCGRSMTGGAPCFIMPTATTSPTMSSLCSVPIEWRHTAPHRRATDPGDGRHTSASAASEFRLEFRPAAAKRACMPRCRHSGAAGLWGAVGHSQMPQPPQPPQR